MPWDVKGEFLDKQTKCWDFVFLNQTGKDQTEGVAWSRSLGDFAEISWLRLRFQQIRVVEKANWIWHLIWQHGCVLPSRPQYECSKWSAAQYGNKMSGFVYLFLSCFFSQNTFWCWIRRARHFIACLDSKLSLTARPFTQTTVPVNKHTTHWRWTWHKALMLHVRHILLSCFQFTTYFNNAFDKPFVIYDLNAADLKYSKEPPTC